MLFARGSLEGQRAFLNRALSLLEDVYRNLCATVYVDDEPELTQRALGTIIAIGTRQLKVAHLLIEENWAPEAASPLRSAWESAVDVGFILSKTGPERHSLSQTFMAMRQLRLPGHKQALAMQPRAVRDRFRRTFEEIEALHLEYADAPGLDLRRHWSGERNRGIVRSAAYAHWERSLGPRATTGFARVTQQGIFEVGSSTVHADPAASRAIPRDERGHLLIEPHPDQLTANTFSACITATLLLAAIRERVSTVALREEISSTVNGFDELLRQIAAAHRPARRGRRPRSRGRRDR